MYFYLILTLIFANRISEIFCDCVIRIDDHRGPELWKKYGSKTLKFQSVSNTFKLKTDQLLSAVCSNGFESPSGYTEKWKVVVECNRNDYIYINSELYGYSNSVTLTCRSFKATDTFNLYETVQSFSWCDSKYMSYMIAKKSLELSYLDHVAAICYDLENMKLISILYSLTNSYPVNLTEYELRELFADTQEVFSHKKLSYNSYNTEQLQNWYNLGNYQYSSIIQNQYLLKNGFNEFGSMFDIIWWPNLRFGNWKSYLTELNKQNEIEPFNIIAGVSEIAKVPIVSDCNKTTTMVEMKDTTYSDDIPLFVWNYVESVLNETNKFVVIGVNTPFNKYYNKTDLIFCQNICSNIEWLKNVRSSFSHPTLGIVFCCTVDEVDKSKRLNGFPSNIIAEEPTQTTPILHED